MADSVTESQTIRAGGRGRVVAVVLLVLGVGTVIMPKWLARQRWASWWLAGTAAEAVDGMDELPAETELLPAGAIVLVIHDNVTTTVLGLA